MEYFKCGIAPCGDDTMVDNRTNVCEDPHINNVGRAPHRFETVVMPVVAPVFATTIITDIQWKTSAKGFNKPIITFNPIILNNCKVFCAMQLHPDVDVKKLKIGTAIRVELLGDIIPTITQIYEDAPAVATSPAVALDAAPVVTTPPVVASDAAPAVATPPAVASEAAPAVVTLPAVASEAAPVAAPAPVVTPKSMYVVASDENDTAWIKTVTVVTKTEPHASGKMVVHFNHVSLNNILFDCTMYSTSNVNVNDLLPGTIIWVGRTKGSYRVVVLGIAR